MADYGHLVTAQPYKRGQAITTSDSTTYSPALAGLYVGVSGDVAITDGNGTDLVFKSVPVGFFQVQCRKVKATSTTATNIIGLNHF